MCILVIYIVDIELNPEPESGSVSIHGDEGKYDSSIMHVISGPSTEC